MANRYVRVPGKIGQSVAGERMFIAFPGKQRSAKTRESS
jgi:hypothetical protein